MWGTSEPLAIGIKGLHLAISRRVRILGKLERDGIASEPLAS